MVSKCANPTCSTPFHYLREGKIFRVEVEVAPTPTPQDTVELSDGSKFPFLLTTAKKAIRKTEHFWLCGPCSQTLKLQFDKDAGITVLPKERVQARAAHAAAS